MIFHGNAITMEEHEPAFRSCWQCNGCHEHLKRDWYVKYCCNCGHYYLGDKILGDFYDGHPDTPEGDNAARQEMTDWLRGLGVKDGESTSKLGTGKVLCIQFGPTGKGE